MSEKKMVSRKEYLITVKIDDDTIMRATLSKVIKSKDQVSEILHNALGKVGMPRHGSLETFSNKDTTGLSYQFRFVQGGDLIKVLRAIKENLALGLKMKPEEIGLTLTSIVDWETGNLIF
jgi:hypothetical protein